MTAVALTEAVGSRALVAEKATITPLVGGRRLATLSVTVTGFCPCAPLAGETVCRMAVLDSTVKLSDAEKLPSGYLSRIR